MNSKEFNILRSCVTCKHESVCSFKNNYDRICQNLENALSSMEDKGISTSFVTIASPACYYYWS